MPRGRTLEFNPDKVLETALLIFWQQGFKGTSLSNLTAATGVAKPGLYNVFGDKEALFIKALQRYFEEFATGGLEVLEAHEDARTAIRAYLKHNGRHVTNPKFPAGCLLVNCILEHDLLSKEARSELRKLQQQTTKALLSCLMKAQENGQLPPDENLEDLAQFYNGQTAAMAVMARGGADEKTIEFFIEHAMRAWPKEG